MWWEPALWELTTFQFWLNYAWTENNPLRISAVDLSTRIPRTTFHCNTTPTMLCNTSFIRSEKDLNFWSQTDTLSCVVLPLLYSSKHWQRSLQATSMLTRTLTGSSSRSSSSNSSSSEGSLCSAGSTAHLFWSWRRFWCSLVRNWTRSGRSRWSSGDGETWEGSSDKKDRGRWFWAMPSCSCWPEWVQTEDSEAGPGSSMTGPPWWGWLNGCGALPARWKAMLFYIWPLGEGSHSSYHESVMTEGTQSAS